MTVGGGGLNADGCLIEFFADTSSTANAVPLPPLGKANVTEVRADGAMCGIGILTREINDLPYERE